MKQRVLRSRYSLFFLYFLLNACSGVPVQDTGEGNKEAYRERFEALGDITSWGVTGKISLDDGDHGGSGSLRWNIGPDRSGLDFHGAMGRGAWQLQYGTDGAVLKEANGQESSASGVDALIQDRMGWPIPVDALQWWVRGLVAPGLVDERKLDAQGRLVSLNQFGWSIDFDRYDEVDDMLLPVRLDATRENYRVKLAIRRWRIGADLALPN